MLLPKVAEDVTGFASRTGHGFTYEAATRHMHAEFAQASISGRLHRKRDGVLRYL